MALRHVVTGAATTRGVVARAGFFATMQEQARQLTWGVTTGESDSNYALAAELLLSFAPGVGLLFDGRDVVKQLVALWPGGEDPDWAVFALAALGIATEVPPLNVGVNAAVSALKNAIKAVPVGPLRRWLFRNTLEGITAALRTNDTSWFSRNEEFFSRLTRECAGARYAGATAGSAAFCLKSTLNRLGQQAAGDYSSLKNRIGDVEAEDLLAKLSVQADIDDDDLRRILEALGSGLDVATIDGLRVAGRLEIVSRAIAKADWDKKDKTTGAMDTVIRYLANVNHFGPSSPIIKHLDDVSDLPGSDFYARQGIPSSGVPPLGTKGIQFELDVIEQFRSEGISRLNVPRGTSANFNGDVDLLTNSSLFSIKHTRPRVREKGRINLDLLVNLIEDAKNNSVEPVLALSSEYLSDTRTQRFLDDMAVFAPEIRIKWVTPRIPGLPGGN
ncbi:MAG: hypothetical protein AAFQ86_01225 [Bacteroidota bacterium]